MKKVPGGACKQLDELMAEYAKLKEQDGTVEADIKEAEAAIDAHTVDNRQKRKGMQEERNRLAKIMEALGSNMGHGQKAYEQLLQSIESALALAARAEGWIWKEVEAHAEPGTEDHTEGYKRSGSERD